MKLYIVEAVSHNYIYACLNVCTASDLLDNFELTNQIVDLPDLD